MLIKRKEEMKNHTSFKIGGIVDIFAEPENIEELNADYHNYVAAFLGFDVTTGSNLKNINRSAW